MANKKAGDQFDENTFYIPDCGDGVTLCGHKTKCRECGRKILIQLPMFSVPHHFDAMPTCAECLKLDAEWSKQHPEVAEDLAKWVAG